MDVGITVSIIAIIISFVFSMGTFWKSTKRETRNDTAQTTTIIVKLECISAGIAEIRSDMKSVREEIKDHETRLVRLEERDKAR